MPKWQVPLMWPGETVFVVAGGTSVAAQNTDALRGRPVVAVNSSYERVPFCGIVFFADERWWNDHCKRPALAACVKQGAKLVTVSNAATELPGGLPLYKLQRVIPNTREHVGRAGPGYSHEPDKLVAQRTSLQGAMNLAGLAGAKRIVLLGADMGRGPDGATHHHSPHKWGNKPGNTTWDIQMQQLRLIVKPLHDLGIQVINTSLISRIPWWPKVDLADVLAGREIDYTVDLPMVHDAPQLPPLTMNHRKSGYSGGIMLDDQSAIRNLASEFNVKSLLEFGPGASTRFWLEAGVQQVTSCEHTQEWRVKAQAMFAHDKRVKVLAYENNPEVFVSGLFQSSFDAAFVDSPQGYKPEHLRDGCARLNTLRFALNRAPVVFLHDAKRPGEQASLGVLMREGYRIFQKNTQKGIAVIRRP